MVTVLDVRVEVPGLGDGVARAGKVGFFNSGAELVEIAGLESTGAVGIMSIGHSIRCSVLSCD